MADPAIVQIIQRFLDRLRAAGLDVTRAILFGSHARGVATAESDVDVLLLSPEFENLTWEQESLAWQVAQATDWRLEPVLCGESLYETNDWHPLILRAKDEGIEILSTVESPAMRQ